jgi:hypothetical protein
MQRALEKVPVGAVLDCDDELLGEGFNLSVYIPTGRVGEAFGVDPTTVIFATSLGGPVKTPCSDGTTHFILDPAGAPGGRPSVAGLYC